MADTGGVTIFIFVFITVLGLILNSMGYAVFTYITPTIFAVGQILFLIVLGLTGGQFQILGSSAPLKGIALVAWGGWLFLYISSLSIPPEISLYMYPIIIVPCLIGMGYELLEVGKQ